ncbi:MAG TPA: uroporphyrinogen decarboxylase family protein [Spirochaetia bacterium]|nr:uroporphyrinogen decarboxylase family protein [Spirochaetia bacterium]
MVSLDRVKRAIHGQQLDRFPTFPISIASSCALTGTPQGRYSLDSDVLAQTLLQVREMFDFDGVYVSRDNWIYHEALGGELNFPEDDEPYSAKALLQAPSEHTRLRVPEPNRAPGMRTVLAAARQVVRAVGGEYYVQANIDTGPFSLGAELMGLENFLIAVSTLDEAEVRSYLDFCTSVVVAYGEAMIETGVHGIQYGDACASLVSPEMYRNLVLPYQAESVARLAGRDCDLWIHICGNTEHLLPMVADLPIDGFEVDAKVPLATARRLIGESIGLKGNIDTSLLLQRSPDEVYEETLRILRDYGQESGLVFSPGCGVPRMTPRANLTAMVAACREHSPQAANRMD